jgi:hypothetical protein
MASNANPAGATSKEEYELLYGLMKDSYSGLIDFEFKHGTILSVVAGWFITSDKARDFLSTSIISVLLVLVIMIALTTFHARWVHVYKARSDHAFERLQTLSFMPEPFLKLNAIPDASVKRFVGFHAIVTVGICLMVLETALGTNLRM